MLPPDMLIDAQDQSSIELGPGAILSLNPGEDVQFADPKHPNTGYDAFTNALIRQIGAALEIPPEVLFKQFTTSYSAARGALNEFWRTCSMQRDWFTDDFCKGFLVKFSSDHVGMVQRRIGSKSSHTRTAKGYKRWTNAKGNVEKLVTMGSPSATAMHHTIWPEVEPSVEEYLQERLQAQVERVLARAGKK